MKSEPKSNGLAVGRHQLDIAADPCQTHRLGHRDMVLNHLQRPFRAPTPGSSGPFRLDSPRFPSIFHRFSLFAAHLRSQRPPERRPYLAESTSQAPHHAWPAPLGALELLEAADLGRLEPQLQQPLVAVLLQTLKLRILLPQASRGPKLEDLQGF